MSAPRGGRVRTLLGMLLLEQWRERAETLMSVVLLFGAGVGVAALPEDLLHPPDERGPNYTCVSRPEDPPTVAIVGEQPPWLRWPEPLVPPEQADVLLRVEDEHIDVVPLREGVRLGRVTPCLKQLARAERQRRLDELGVLVAGDQMLIVEAEGDAPPRHAWEPTPGRATVAGAAGMLALSACVSAAARARSSGFRETLAVGPVRASEWAVALVLFSLISALICGVLVSSGLFGASALLGRTADAPEPLALGALCVLLATISLRVGHDATDYVAAMARIVALTFGVMLLGGASSLADKVYAPWGAAVPGGLLLRAVTGEPVGAELLLINGAVSMVAAALLLRSAIQAIAADDPTLAPSARTVLRRASGDWRPEFLLIALIALAGEYFTSPLLGRSSMLTAATLKFLVFFLGPVLVAPALLGLPGRPLLGLGRPSLRAVAAIPLILFGTVSGGMLAAQASGLIFHPDEATMRQFAEGLSGLAEGPGILLLTLGAGVLEELLFRGLLMGLLLKRGPVWQAILLQALVFGVAHMLGFRLASTFAIGLVLGVLRWRSGSVLPGIAAHTLHNALLLIYGDRLGLEALTVPALLGGLSLGGLGLWIAGSGAAGPRNSTPER